MKKEEVEGTRGHPTKKKGQPTNEKTSTKRKANKKAKETVMEFRSNEEEEATFANVKVETLIAIQGKMEEKFAKAPKKEGKIL